MGKLPAGQEIARKLFQRLTEKGTDQQGKPAPDEPPGDLRPTGSGDNTAPVVDTTSGKEYLRVTHEEAVYDVAFSADGWYLATGSGYNTAPVVDTTSGKEYLRVTHEEAVYDVAFSADGRYLATGSGDNTARVVETTSGKRLSGSCTRTLLLLPPSRSTPMGVSCTPRQ
jgi:WD40 repeat protein